MVIYEIYKNLYLSSYSAAKEYTFINESFIVNCTTDIPMIHNFGVRVSVNEDGNTDNLLFILPDIVRIIDEQILKGIKVIVHCLSGQQRSPAVVCAYIIWKNRNITLQQAILHIRSIKNDVFFWSVHFRDALELYEMLVLREINGDKQIVISGLMRPPQASRATLPI